VRAQGSRRREDGAQPVCGESNLGNPPSVTVRTPLGVTDVVGDLT
jgi:hypothetical protein